MAIYLDENYRILSDAFQSTLTFGKVCVCSNSERLLRFQLANPNVNV